MKNLSNKVQLIGNLGMDPEVKKFKTGNQLAKFSMATNETFKNSKGEKTENTHWHNIIAWGKTAGIIEKHLKKGNRIAIEGKLVNRAYKNKEGEKRTATEIVVSNLLMLSK